MADIIVEETTLEGKFIRYQTEADNPKEFFEAMKAHKYYYKLVVKVLGESGQYEYKNHACRLNEIELSLKDKYPKCMCESEVNILITNFRRYSESMDERLSGHIRRYEKFADDVIEDNLKIKEEIEALDIKIKKGIQYPKIAWAIDISALCVLSYLVFKFIFN